MKTTTCLAPPRPLPSPHAQPLPSRAGGTRARRRALLLVGLLAHLAADAADADAQIRRGRAADVRPTWAPVAIGVRFGWDGPANGEVLGAHVRIPVVRSGIVELVPTAEVIFPPGTKEYQYNLEATYVTGGARGGPFVGGGVGWRDAVLADIDLETPRETYFSWVAVGVKGGVGRLQLEAAFRWAFLDGTSYRPNPATLGLNFPLWRVTS
jgi:hypothetical protein